ncbi:ADP compounds hydrolase NudE [Thiotrichales bacterium 19S3-11]|nr:ADP compounds hydrolase NudE [Thiotrichales bacterium 19S3-11]
MSLPKINKIIPIAQSKLFNIESVDLTFSNGQKRTYERLSPHHHRSVMIVPMLDEQTIVLVKEYSVGIENYTISFPKGVVEDEETLFEGANREMMEEVGKGANHFEFLTSMMLSPNYMRHSIDIVIATDLYDQQLEGDEPEKLEVIQWKLEAIDQLIAQPDLMEARSIATALIMWKRWISKLNQS